MPYPKGFGVSKDAGDKKNYTSNSQTKLPIFTSIIPQSLNSFFPIFFKRSISEKLTNSKNSLLIFEAAWFYHNFISI